MSCIIKKRVMHKSYYLVRYFTTKIINFQTNQPEDFVLKPEDNFTVTRKVGAKFLKIAIIGSPNSGKSTLINQLVNRSVCPTSSKVHTTEAKCDAVYSSEDMQLVFVDTPGLVSDIERKKYKLKNSFKEDPEISVRAVDVVGVVHDVGNRMKRNKLDEKCLQLLKSINSDVTMLLILNKVDLIKEKVKLLELIRILTSKNGWPNFTDVFLISALKNDGVDTLREYLMLLTKSQDWQYSEDAYTNQLPETIIQTTVRAKLLDNLPQELGYISIPVLEHMEISPDGSVRAHITIRCNHKKKEKILIGVKGKKIKVIAQQCETELQHAFRAPVYITINVQFKQKNV